MGTRHEPTVLLRVALSARAHSRCLGVAFGSDFAARTVAVAAVAASGCYVTCGTDAAGVSFLVPLL